MTPPAEGQRRGRRGGKPGGGHGSGKPGGAKPGAGGDLETLNPDAFARALVRRMEACPDAGQLNDRVLQPFIAALEAVCGARGYVLNVYGDTANLAFTGDEDDAETIYQLIEAYLDGGTEDTG
jgi:hypothetical protein